MLIPTIFQVAIATVSLAFSWQNQDVHLLRTQRMSEPSFDTAAYVDQQAIALGLPIADYRSGVIANFERIQAIAQQVLDFPLPVDLVAAPVFEP